MDSQRIYKMAAPLQNKYILHDKADFSTLQDNHIYDALQKINRDLEMIKTFLGIEDEFNAEKLAKMNAEYNRFLAVEKQQLAQYRFSTEVPKTYSQAVSLQKPAARPEKQLSDADGWKEVKRRKMKSTDVRDDERFDPAFKVVKARAGKPRGASAARLPAASTAKVDFSGARSHPPPARATGELVSLSPPARVGGAVPPLVHPLPNSSCVVDEKDAEPVSSENAAQESRGRENLAKVCRRDRAFKSVKALAGSQRGASAARRTEICTAQAIENAGARSHTPPAPLAGEHPNPPPSAASADGAYSCSADRISPPEVKTKPTTKPNRNRSIAEFDNFLDSLLVEDLRKDDENPPGLIDYTTLQTNPRVNDRPRRRNEVIETNGKRETPFQTHSNMLEPI
ncbi:Hypothetical predicted protein [Cloeon dipterum]|uniref:Uncharacterized protein n=1 Tax=Cloeon dipterum TaxID=197152 RepID=A0A8S1DSQ0_9INSE|nr:Hypothetical predicted protein [Cloeon dipterum]CAB3388527.1 Hypothetical predicted protein [Cloeon dipterum]